MTSHDTIKLGEWTGEQTGETSDQSSVKNHEFPLDLEHPVIACSDKSFASGLRPVFPGI